MECELALVVGLLRDVFVFFLQLPNERAVLLRERAEALHLLFESHFLHEDDTLLWVPVVFFFSAP